MNIMSDRILTREVLFTLVNHQIRLLFISLAYENEGREYEHNKLPIVRQQSMFISSSFENSEAFKHGNNETYTYIEF